MTALSDPAPYDAGSAADNNAQKTTEQPFRSMVAPRVRNSRTAARAERETTALERVGTSIPEVGYRGILGAAFINANVPRF